jgi:hypothetical protein
MACKSCPGAGNGARLLEAVRQNRVNAVVQSTVYQPAPKGQEMILILYTSKNVGMHTVKSPLRPKMKSGNIINDYGRRRGARPHELSIVDELGGVMTTDQALEHKMLNRCVFFVHPVDVAARPDVFRVIDPEMGKEEVVDEEIDNEVLGDEKEETEDEFTNYDIDGMTKGIAEDLIANGWVTVAELASAEPFEIEESMTATKKMTKLERAEKIIASAKELA